MFDEPPSKRATIIGAIGLIALAIGLVASLFLIATQREWAPRNPTATEAVERSPSAPTR
ncbi:MAG TPA: hypothetical protein VEX35_02555 [Allosphingosinicella sp.]|nr:hypothetical protein [Allosphingosinicella sp.]